MFKPKYLVLAFLIVCAAASGAFSAETIELRLDPEKMHNAASFPVRSGLPLPYGAVKDAENVRLLAGEKEVELQTEVLTRYGDGSIKWLLLELFAKPAEQMSLEYGNDVKRAGIKKKIAAAEEGDTVSVDTGKLKAVVSKSGMGFFDKLYFDMNGDGKYQDNEKLELGGEARPNFMDYIHTSGIGTWPTMGTTGDGAVVDRSKIKIDELKLEVEGPLHAVVMIAGEYRYTHVNTTVEHPYMHAAYIGTRPKTSNRIPFVLRLHFYRDSGLLELQHNFIFEGDPDRDFAKSLALVVPGPKGAGRTATARFDIRSKSFKLTGSELASVSQTSADTCTVWKSAEGDPGKAVVADAKRSSGWLDISNDKWGVAVGVWRIWQNYPKALRAGADGQVYAYLWPQEAGPMDLRRYTRQWVVGETGARGGVDSYSYSRAASRGVAKTHRVMFYLHSGDAEAAKVPATMACFSQKPMALPSPAYLCRLFANAGVELTPPIPSRNEDLEKMNESILDWYLFNQEHFRWYGMFNYGDLQQEFERTFGHGRWESDFGRWAWFHGDASGHKPYYAFISNFVRTGKRRYFDFVQAEMKHITDVDMVNAEEYPWGGENYRDLRGCAHRHNAQHWGCFFIGSRGVHVRAVSTIYYLTGDERLRDVLDILISQAYKEIVNKETWRTGHSGRRDILNRLYCALERTGDKKYKDIIQEKGSWYFSSYGYIQSTDKDGEKDDFDWIRRPAEKALGKPGRRGGVLTQAGALANGVRYLGDEKYYRKIKDQIVPAVMKAYQTGPYSLPRSAWPGSYSGKTQSNWCPLPGYIPVIISALNTYEQRKEKEDK